MSLFEAFRILILVLLFHYWIEMTSLRLGNMLHLQFLAAYAFISTLVFAMLIISFKRKKTGVEAKK